MMAPKKIYSIDPGMIEIVAFKFSRDLGWVVENVVAIENETIFNILFYFLHTIRNLSHFRENHCLKRVI